MSAAEYDVKCSRCPKAWNLLTVRSGEIVDDRELIGDGDQDVWMCGDRAACDARRDAARAARAAAQADLSDAIYLQDAFPQCSAYREDAGRKRTACQRAENALERS